jgi:BA14K-like protein
MCGVYQGATMMKTLAIAALAVFAGFAAPAAVQAGQSFVQDAPVVLTGGGFYDDGIQYRPRHLRPRHQQNGFSLEFQFGQPGYHYQPRHPRPVYRHRPVIHISQAHVQWCYNRYRTYDHRSNSFVIRHGQRAYCVSPYSY